MARIGRFGALKQVQLGERRVILPFIFAIFKINFLFLVPGYSPEKNHYLVPQGIIYCNQMLLYSTLGTYKR